MSTKLRPALRSAAHYTLPILAGFLFLGIAYGILMRSLGFAAWYPIVMSIVIFAGSMQFVAANLLTQPFDPLTALALTLLVNARHIFYGLSLLDVYRNVGGKKWYLIFGLCDETFSINCSVEPPEGVDRSWFYFFVTFLDSFYWVAGSALGALFGQFIHFDTTGIEFAMTALFLIIFVGQWERESHHISSLVGLGISLLCLLLVGPKHFVVAAMVGILFLLTILRKPLERKERLT